MAPEQTKVQLADELAKAGAATPIIGPEPFCGISFKMIKEEIRRKWEIQVKNEWAKLPRLRQTKVMVGNYNRKRSGELLEKTRIKVKAIVGLLTGHSKLNDHMQKIGLGEDGSCRFCGKSRETSQHILQECEAIIRQRWQHLRAISPKDGALPSFSINQILGLLRELKLLGKL